MFQGVGEVKSPIFTGENSRQDVANNETGQIDDTIENWLNAGEAFEFVYKGRDYVITQSEAGYIAQDSQGNIVDPNVQINSKKTVDGFVEVRGLYESGGKALYIGNDPSKNDREILLIEEDPHLDRDDLSSNPFASILLGEASEPVTEPVIEPGAEPGAEVDLGALMKTLNYEDAAQYQSDKDSSINMAELDSYLIHELGVTLSDEQLSELFGQLDQNGSGNIREREFDGAVGAEGVNKAPEQNNREVVGGVNGDTGQVLPPTDHNANAPALARKRIDVSRGEVSGWSTLDLPKGTADIQYESLGRPFSGSVSTEGADYILFIKSGGKVHDEIADPEKFFGTRDGEILGVTGSKDKGTMLVDVRELDRIDVNTGNSSVQIMRIKTTESLTVLNNGGGALDNDLVRNGRSRSDEAIDRLGYSIAHRRVEAWNDGDNFFTVYADDESKHDHRVEKYGAASAVYYYGGDDSAYVMPPGARAETGSGSGNGAIIHLGVV